MGFIDSDTHVHENEHTWEYFDPSEREYAPKTVNNLWEVGDLAPGGSPFNPETRPERYHELYPRGSVDLTDPSARVRRMDELGVDVQILFSSWWLGNDVSSPIVEAALARSWNRWMAENTANSGGRLLWALEAPIRIPERAIEEMTFAKEHGAVAVHLRGVRHGLSLAHPSYLPLFEAAQDLDLVMAVHVGGDSRSMHDQPAMIFQNSLAPVAGAFYAVMKTGLPQRFPQLRWAFLEAGATWLRFAIQEASRSDDSVNPSSNKSGYRNFRDWQSSTVGLLADLNCYVACQIDDDIPYLSEFVGSSNFVHGTDYGHLDVGSDPYGLQIITERSDMDAASLRGIVDDNGRRLWKIDSTFTPAPPPVERTAPKVEAIPDYKVEAVSK